MRNKQLTYQYNLIGKLTESLVYEIGQRPTFQRSIFRLRRTVDNIIHSVDDHLSNSVHNWSTTWAQMRLTNSAASAPAKANYVFHDKITFEALLIKHA